MQATCDYLGVFRDQPGDCTTRSHPHDNSAMRQGAPGRVLERVVPSMALPRDGALVGLLSWFVSLDGLPPFIGTSRRSDACSDLMRLARNRSTGAQSRVQLLVRWGTAGDPVGGQEAVDHLSGRASLQPTCLQRRCLPIFRRALTWRIAGGLPGVGRPSRG